MSGGLLMYRRQLNTIKLPILNGKNICPLLSKSFLWIEGELVESCKSGFGAYSQTPYYQSIKIKNIKKSLLQRKQNSGRIWLRDV